MSDGYYSWQPTCSKCGRFVAMSAVHPVNYRADAGFYGEVDEGHDSHPDCGEGVLISEVAIWINKKGEGDE